MDPDKNLEEQRRVRQELVYAVSVEHEELGPGNNIALRLAASAGRIDYDFELDGEQHERFEDTLP